MPHRTTIVSLGRARDLCGALAASILALVVLAGAPARADDAPAKVAAINKLNKQALDAFDNLNFDQAKALLEQALEQAESARLGNDPVAARTHLHLGMVLIAGFQRRDPAVAEFKTALRIQPDAAPLPGLFNPEVQTVFDEVRANLHAEPEPPRPAATAKSRPDADAKAARSQSTGAAVKAANTAPAKSAEQIGATNSAADSTDSSEAEEEEEQPLPPSRRAPFFLSVGLGSGFGTAKGHLDANKVIYQGDRQDNSWPGGLAPSGLGHLVLSVGYFLRPELMLSAEGRLQIVSGTTTVSNTPSCMPSCSAPSTGIAAMAKASWFFSPAPIRPFVVAGAGAGSIRQVVKVNVVPTAGDPDTHCGSSGKEACVDTVTGGPVFLAAGGGLAYEMGSVALLGSLTANVGVPNFMLNVDALLGVGLRL